MNTTTLALSLLWTTLLLRPSVATANVYEVFGAGARAQGMAGAMTAAATDASAVWHNPAGLTLSKPSLSVGFGGAFDRTAILLAPRPAGYDPPAYSTRLSPRSDSRDQGPILGVSLGLNLRLLTDDLRFGALVYLPSEGLAHTQGYFANERQQYFDNRLRFERLEERLRAEVLAAALSYRAADWLSFGVGLMAQSSAKNRTRVYTPNAADPSQVDMTIELEQAFETALIAGVQVQPWRFLRFGLALRDELSFDVRGRSEVQIAGQEGVEPYPVVQPIALTEHVSVPRIQLGTALLTDKWTVTLDGSYDLWSRFRDAQGNVANFSDGYTVATGFEYTVRPGTRVRGGAGWHPSPVPDQTGRTNFVDNDRVVVSVGSGNSFRLFDQDFEVDLGLQVHALLARSVTKQLPAKPALCTTTTTQLCDELEDANVDTPLFTAAETRGLQTGNPGFPGYSSGGYMLVAGTDVRWVF